MAWFSFLKNMKIFSTFNSQSNVMLQLRLQGGKAPWLQTITLFNNLLSSRLDAL